MNTIRQKTSALLGLLGLLTLGAIIVGVAYVAQSPDMWKHFFAWRMHAEYLGSEGVILQDKRTNCGPAALKMVLDSYGVRSTVLEIEQQVGLNANGSTMLALKEMAELKGLRARGWKFALEDFLESSFPAILFINDDHFVVADSVSREETLFLRDPALGRLRIGKDNLSRIWKGETLVFEKDQRADK